MEVIEAPVVASVPPIAVGRTVVCLGSGPSLTVEDVDYCRHRAVVVAVKDAIRLAPWADVLYACGEQNDMSQWWSRNAARVEAFAGLKFSLDPTAAKWATVLRQEVNGSPVGTDPTCLHTPIRFSYGWNSGAQALNVAVLLGAKRIVLLGYDMGMNGSQKYFFGNRTSMPSGYPEWMRLFVKMAEPLEELGISVLNASRVSALDVFERVSLQEALA